MHEASIYVKDVLPFFPSLLLILIMVLLEFGSKNKFEKPEESQRKKKQAGKAKYLKCAKCNILVRFDMLETHLVCSRCKSTISDADETTDIRDQDHESKVGGNNESNTSQTSKLLSCPSCSCSIKVPNPPPKIPGKCRSCNCTFKIEMDKYDNLHIYNLQAGKNTNTKKVLSREEYLRVLDLSEEASSEQIQAAYRKKISEYHPDKVASCGVEIRKISEEMTKKINAAYEFLRRKASNH